MELKFPCQSVELVLNCCDVFGRLLLAIPPLSFKVALVSQSTILLPVIDNPFDPRSEVSADAKHIAGRIVKHLWIIFVLLPVVLALLYSLLK